MSNDSAPISRRAMTSALLSGAGASVTGCFGSFGLTTGVYDWNDSFGNKWLKWLIFLGLNIVPVYGIAVFVDSLVLNSIEFWFGDNPVARQQSPHHRVVSTPTDDPDEIRHELYEGERRVAVLYLRREGESGASLRDAQGRLLTRVKLDASHLTLSDSNGGKVVEFDRDDCRTVADKIRQGNHLESALFDQIASTGQATALSDASAGLYDRIVF